MKRSPRTIALLATTATLVLLAGCFAVPSESAPETRAADGELPRVDVSFVAHGIAVIEDVTEEWPEDALMASPESAIDVMQAEVDSGGGLPGIDLDEMIIMPEGAVPFSYLIAAWLSDPSTPRAEIAREWMPGTPDWTRAQSIWYPRAALLLFVADAMEASLADFGDPRAEASTPQSNGLEVALAGVSRMNHTVDRGVLQAPCSAVTGFFRRMIDNLFSAVQLPPDFLARGGALGAVSGFLAALYNTAVALAKQAVLTVIESLTAPILHAIGSAVAIVGLVSHLSTYVLGITMTVVTDDGIRLKGQDGDWFAFLNSNKPLEPQLTDCLAALGQRPLRKIVEPGSTVTWRQAIPYKANGDIFGRRTLNYLSLTSTVDPKERIVLPWTAAIDIESSQPEQLGTLGIRGEVPKGDVAQLLSTARRLIQQAISSLASNAGPLAPQVEAAVTSILQGTLNRMEAEILGIGRSALMIVGTGQTTFYYKEPDPPSGPAGDLTPDCFVGAWQFQRIASSNWISFSSRSFRRFSLDVTADGLFILRTLGGVANFDADYEGSTRFTTAPNGSGTWTVTAPDLTTHYTREEFGPVVFGQGMNPTVLSCSPDGKTLFVTGKPTNSYGQNYGSTVWQFRRQ